MKSKSIPLSLPKALAIVFASLLGAWWLGRLDAAALAKMASVPPSDFAQHQRELHGQSFVMHFFECLVGGVFYIVLVDLLTQLIGYLFPSKPEPDSTTSPVTPQPPKPVQKVSRDWLGNPLD